MVSIIERTPSHVEKISSGSSITNLESRAFLINVEREFALQKLLNLLEAEAVINPARAGYARANALSRIARLHSAHATYALSTSSEMKRIAEGAWLKSKHLEYGVN